jgi:hypothetical protein
MWCYACDSGYDFRYDDDEEQKQKAMRVAKLLVAVRFSLKVQNDKEEGR